MPSNCFLDALKESDIQCLIRLHTNSAVRAYLGGPLSLLDAERRAVHEVSAEREMPMWAVRRGSDALFLGLLSFDTHHDGLDIEVSYQLLPEHQGNGYATEALTLALHFASSRMALNRVIAETQTKNARSVRLLERVGMVFERQLTRFGEMQSIYAVNL